MPVPAGHTGPRRRVISFDTVAEIARSRGITEDADLADFLASLKDAGIELGPGSEVPPSEVAPVPQPDWIVKPEVRPEGGSTPGLTREQLERGTGTYIDPRTGLIKVGEPPAPTWKDRLMAGAEAPIAMASGAGKSAIEAINNIRSGLLPPGVTGETAEAFRKPLIDVNTEAVNPMEHLGKMGEQVAEYSKLPGSNLLRLFNIKGLEEAPWLQRLLGAFTESMKSGAISSVHGGDDKDVAISMALGAIPGARGVNPERTAERARELFAQSISPRKGRVADILEMSDELMTKGIPVGEGERAYVKGTVHHMRKVSEKALKYAKAEQEAITNLDTPVALAPIKDELKREIEKAIGSKIQEGAIPDDAVKQLFKARNRLLARIENAPRDAIPAGMTRAEWFQQSWEDLLSGASTRYGINTATNVPTWTPDDFEKSYALFKLRTTEANNPEKLKALMRLKRKIDLRDKGYGGQAPASDLIEFKRELNQIAKLGGAFGKMKDVPIKPSAVANRDMAQSIAKAMPDQVKMPDKLFNVAKTIDDELNTAYFRDLTRDDKSHFVRYMLWRVGIGSALGGAMGYENNDINPALYGVAAGATMASLGSSRWWNSLAAHHKMAMARAIKAGDYDTAWGIIRAVLGNVAGGEITKAMEKQDLSNPINANIIAMPQR